MQERTGVVTLGGSPLTLLGEELKEGDTAPSATLIAKDFSPIDPLQHSQGKAKLIITVGSVDTSVCSSESKKFSDAVSTLDSAKIAAYVVSADLPFAQSRWCAAEGVDNLTLLSDYREMALGRNWGVYVKESGLHARAVFVLDANNKVVYREIVPEIENEPDYAAAVSAVKNAAASVK